MPPKAPDWPVKVTYDELPVWMRSARRTLDWPLVVVALLVAALVVPLATGSLPWSAGLRSEVARALELSESIQAGILYPRWAADFNLGYGAPLWNFLPPLPHYLAGLHRILAQTSAEFSVKATLIGALALLGLALFGFARRRWGVYGGLLAAALGLFSPQVALVKPLLDGDLGAVLAAGFWLASLWALDRLLVYGRGANLLLAASTCAAVWLAHQPLNAIFGGLTLAWLLFRLVTGQRADAIRDGLLAYALGFAASAFYWLPAWTERDTVTWQPAQGAEAAVRSSVPVEDLLGWFPAIDRAAINPDAAPALGVALWGAAALALGLIVASRLGRRRGEDTGPDLQPMRRSADREALLFGVFGALLLVAALPPLGELWSGRDTWPPFAPADLVFPAAICLTLLGASLGSRLESLGSPRRALMGMMALAVTIAASGMPALITPRAPSATPELTLAGLVESEVSGVPLAGREPGWLLPRGITALPPVEASLATSYASGLVDKVVRDTLPATTLADTIKHTTHGERIMVRSAGPAEFTLRTFLFDGWRAQLDGRPVGLHATDQGLIALHVPEGRHELVITFGSTAARTAGWVLSGAACVLLLGLAVRQEHQPTRTDEEAAAVQWAAPGARAERGVLIGWVIILAGVALVARLEPNWVADQSPSGTAPPGSAPLQSRFQGGVDLLAYELVRPADEADALALTLYWLAWRPDLADYQVDVQLVSDANPSQVFRLAQRRHPAQIPTSDWPRWPLQEHYVTDSYSLAVLSDLPPGRYRVAIQLGRCGHVDPAPCPAVAPMFVQADDSPHLEQSVVLPDVLAIEG